jgi:tetratricopeptide (TPR) repeat protein
LQVAQALERLHESELERVLPELAHHYTHAAALAGPDRGVRYNLRAAEQAAAAAALAEAAERLATALELGITDEHERVRVQIELALLLAESGDVDQARTLLDEAIVAATRLGDRGQAAYARLLRVRRDWLGELGVDHKTSVAERFAVVEEAIPILTELGDARGLAYARFTLAYAYRSRGEQAAAAEELEQALVSADASGHAPTRSLVITQLVQMLILGPTPADEAIRRCEELKRARRGETVLEATIERGLSLLYAMAGRDDEARDRDRRAGAVLDQVDYHTQAYFRLYAAWAHRLLDDPAAAERHLLAIWERFGGDVAGATRTQTETARLYLTHLYIEQGRWSDAEQWLERADRRVPVLRGSSGVELAARARLAVHRGDLDGALTLALDAVAVAMGDNLNWQAERWLALASVQRARRDEAAAGAAYAKALTLFEQKGNVAAAARVRAEAAADLEPAPVN